MPLTDALADLYQRSLQVPYQNFSLAGRSVCMKRIDLADPAIAGNKFYKLYPNIIAAQQIKATKLLTFGGAYSNHILATSAASKRFGFSSIGVIRGQELADRPLNPILTEAAANGMQLHFIDRQNYREKHQADQIKRLQQQFGDFYMLAEGGSNALAVKGCQQILTEKDQAYDLICCAVGTGATLAGLIQSSKPHQHILGFSALKGHFLQAAVAQWTQKKNWQLISDDTFGGYARSNAELEQFLAQLEQLSSIPLEPIYGGKMLYGLAEMIQRNQIPAKSRILIIHSGGIQHRGGIQNSLAP